MGAFARDRGERKQWWDDHLWAQMLLIAGICVVAGLVVDLGLVGTAIFTVLFVSVTFGLSRAMVGGRHRSSS